MSEPQRVEAVVPGILSDRKMDFSDISRNVEVVAGGSGSDAILAAFVAERKQLNRITVVTNGGGDDLQWVTAQFPNAKPIAGTEGRAFRIPRGSVLSPTHQKKKDSRAQTHHYINHAATMMDVIWVLPRSKDVGELTNIFKFCFDSAEALVVDQGGDALNTKEVDGVPYEDDYVALMAVQATGRPTQAVIVGCGTDGQSSPEEWVKQAKAFKKKHGAEICGLILGNFDLQKLFRDFAGAFGSDGTRRTYDHLLAAHDRIDNGQEDIPYLVERAHLQPNGPPLWNIKDMTQCLVIPLPFATGPQ
jgi:hypothetical protein